MVIKNKNTPKEIHSATADSIGYPEPFFKNRPTFKLDYREIESFPAWPLVELKCLMVRNETTP